MGESGKKFFWENVIFLVVCHAMALAGVAYFVFVKHDWRTFALAGAWFLLSALAVSGGYHRLFAHRAYKASWPVKLFYIAFSSGSFQSSALQWSADHRRHHAMTDQEGDPHDVTKGFWWAHWLWLAEKRTPDYSNVKDLEADPILRFQDKYYLAIGILVAFLIPLGIGFLWHDPIGAVLGAGWLRLLVQYHATFSINSVAHTWGDKPYAKDSSARDGFLTAILTMGEGYHNYHHRFPSDYRNGVKPWQFDPSKWLIYVFEKLHLAWDLKRVPKEAIEKAMESAK